VAKALSDTARDTRILTLRGGIMQGTPITGDDVEALAKLPPLDVLQAQLVGVIVAPLTQLLGLLSAPLTNLVGLIDARIAQLEEGGAQKPVEEPPLEVEGAAEPEAEPETEAPAETDTDDEAAAEADAEDESS
jgi:large subunit ribosomal protein L10